MSVFDGGKDVIRRRQPAVVNKDLAEETTASGYNEEELHRQRNVLEEAKTPEMKLQRAGEFLNSTGNVIHRHLGTILSTGRVVFCGSMLW